MLLEKFRLASECGLSKIELLFWNYSLGLVLLFHLSVKHWTNIFLFVSVFMAAYGLMRERSHLKLVSRNPSVRWMLVALLSPLLAILFSQILRLDFIARDYDGPFRIALGCIVFLYLLGRRVNIVHGIEWGAPLSMIALSFLLLTNQSATERFGGRLATDFVDPLTLGQHSLLIGFICLMVIDISGRDSIFRLVFKVIGVILGLIISVKTESRSAWLALPILFFLLLLAPFYSGNRQRLRPIILLLMIIIIITYFLYPVISTRIGVGLHEFNIFFEKGNIDTSGGRRLALFKSAWELFLQSPLYGYGDRSLPVLAGSGFLEPEAIRLHDALASSGAHSEILQNLIRSGIFGLTSRVLMFILPAIIFYQAIKSNSPLLTAAGKIGFACIAAFFIFGINTETFNLKFTASFYALTMALLGAQVLNRNELNRASP